VENSLEGGIDPVTDLLMATDLTVVAEVYIPVRHCLLSVPETDYRDIKVVYSHPQALGQCRGFISRNHLEPRPYYDTASSAMMLADERPRAAAAIASKLCADIYNLEVIKEDISDHHSNTTRFLVISKTTAPAGGDKCSIIFYARHQAGSLFKILSHFSDNGINLTRLESRPLRDDSGNVAFLMDFQGSDQDPAVKTVLETVHREASLMKVLGCYKEDRR
jgi:prephenate dehydratase